MKHTKLYHECMAHTYRVNQDLSHETRVELCEDVLRLRRIALKLKRLDEVACNGYPKSVTEYRNGKTYRYNVEDEALREQCEKQEVSLEQRMIEIGKAWGANVYHQSDPRGWTVQGFEVKGIRLDEFVNREAT